MDKGKAQQLKKKMAMSIILFLKLCIPGMAKATSPSFHFEIEKGLLDLDRKSFNIVAPRGHAKSSLVAVAFVLWHLFLQDYYEYLIGRTDKYEKKQKYIVLVSKTQKEAIKRLRSIKQVLGDLKSGKQSKRFLSLFGDYGESTAVKWTDALIILKNGSSIEAVGTAQQVRGMLEGTQRPTLAVVDDPEDEGNTKTIDSMMHNRYWLLQGIAPALDPKVGRWVVIGTPQNTDCMVVHLHRALGKNSLWFQNDLATGTSRWSNSGTREEQDIEKESLDELEDDWIEKKTVLWPEWVGEDQLKVHKDLAEEMTMLGSYYREWECKVVGNEEQVFKPEFFEHTWDGEIKRDLTGQSYIRLTHIAGVQLDEPRDITVSISTAVDPAFSVSQYSDRTAIANLATDTEDNMYELEGVYKKLEPDVLLSGIVENHERIQPRIGVIEVTAAQIFVAQELYNQHGLNYVHDKPQDKKKGEGSRIERLQPQMKAGKFFHRKGSPLRSELLSYPRGKDDYADATEKAMRFRIKPRTSSVILNQTELAKSKKREYYDYMTA